MHTDTSANADLAMDEVIDTTGFSLDSGDSVAEREDAGITVYVTNAAGKRLFYKEGTETRPVTILVSGSYSTRYRTAQRKARNQLVQNRRNVEITGDTANEQALDIAAQCCISWQGIVTLPGRPLACNKENAINVLRKNPWVRELVDTAMNDHAAFFNVAS